MGSTIPSSTSPSASSSLGEPLIGLVLPVGMLPPELHGDGRRAPVEVVLLVFSWLFTAVLLLCLMYIPLQLLPAHVQAGTEHLLVARTALLNELACTS